MTRFHTRIVRWASAVALLPLVACGDLLEVDSPGRIADDDLNTPNAVAGMVAGMKYDLSEAVDASLEFLSLASVELYHGGSYDWAEVPRGVFLDEDVAGEWNSPQQARWVAETGIGRIRQILEPDAFARSSAAARANIYAGYANRMLGEMFCTSVIDGGPEVDHAVHFERAEAQFGEAISIAQAAGNETLVNQARAGRASVRAWLGDWSGAVSDAAAVPASFVMYAEIDTEMRNELVYETHNRFEYTVWGTEFEAHPGDPRAPWVVAYNNDGTVANGANGATPHYQQKKYSSTSDDVALSKGTEMLLLRAEAALRSNDIPTAYARMNEARAFYGMDPLAVAGSMDAAWDDLHYERGATLWLEGRRLWDLRRWWEATGPAHHDGLAGRQTCLPIAEAERLSNPNLTP